MIGTLWQFHLEVWLQRLWVGVHGNSTNFEIGLLYTLWSRPRAACSPVSPSKLTLLCFSHVAHYMNHLRNATNISRQVHVTFSQLEKRVRQDGAGVWGCSSVIAKFVPVYIISNLCHPWNKVSAEVWLPDTTGPPTCGPKYCVIWS